MATSADDQTERFYAQDRAQWRTWLQDHHASATGVWLIYYKKHTHTPTIAYDEAVEEALCFGWIDSRPNALDDERYMQLFSPRKPKSPWSKLNKERIEWLMAQQLMAPAGLAVIEAARRDGSWDAYDAIEALRIPDDLRAALATNATARQHFEAFGASSKKQILWWIESAKRADTRAKRVAQIVAAAEVNRNPLAYTAKRRP